MNILKATFEVTAPMFPGGELDGAGRGTAELRPTAIKGALRFWWRALAWGRVGGNVADLKKEEDALFGAAADTQDNRRGQSAFHLRLTESPSACDMVPKGDPVIDKGALREGIHYLGYGPFLRDRDLKKVQVQRPGFKPGARFSIAVRFGPRCTPEQRDQVIAAIKAFGLLGGLGSRARRGLGSVSLVELTQDGEPLFREPDNLEDYKTAIREVLGALSARTSAQAPAWTAFCAAGQEDEDHGGAPLRGTVCAVLQPGRDVPTGATVEPEARALSNMCGDDPTSAIDVLNMLGVGMMLYRSWGQNGTIAYNMKKQPAWRQFKRDHDWFKTDMQKLRPNPKTHPDRIAFGLPHSYHSNGAKDVGVAPSDQESDRRASPLMLHVHRIGERHYGVALVFPGLFLQDLKLNVLRGKDKSETLNQIPIPAKIDDGVLFDMIDGNGRRQSPFAATMIRDGWTDEASSGAEHGHGG